MSVWVCSRRESFTHMRQSQEWCEYYKNGICKPCSTPCDAVEYAPVKKPCIWKQTPDGQYETACGNMFEFTSDGPGENGFKHCPYCGGVLKNGGVG